MAGCKRWVGATLGLVAGLSTTASAYAWKPITHAYLAQQAVNDLLDGDDTITIEQLDPTAYSSKTPADASAKPTVLGKFKVSPEIQRVIKNCPKAYYTGVLGPDVLPDILTGQDIIHPPAGPDPKDGTEINVGGTGTAFWWNQMWTRTGPGGDFKSDCNRAYMLGMFGHGAGDMFAHTFVNAQTGNIFSLFEHDKLSPNGIRHVILEGYLFQRTPALGPHKGQSVYDLVKQGMTDDLAKFNRFVLDPYPLGDSAGVSKKLSLFYHMGRLKEWVSTHRHDLNQLQLRWKAEYEAYSAKYHKTNCFLHPIDCSVLVADIAIAYGKHKLGGGIIRNVILPYMDDWVHHIDEGLLEWVRVNHRLGIILMFTDPTKEKSASTMDQVLAVLGDFAGKYLTKMVGIPGWLVDAAVYMKEMVDKITSIIADVIAPFKEAAENIKDLAKVFAKKILKQATGFDVDEFKEYWLNPSKYIDQAFGSWKFKMLGKQINATAAKDPYGNAVTVASLNKWMGLKAKDHFYQKDGERWDWRRFAPAFNTVQMIKLQFLEGSAVNQILKQLKSDKRWPGGDNTNVMLGGWQGGMDAGNQWANGPRLIFANECRVFNSLFMKHLGPTLDKPYQHKNECANSDSWVNGGPAQSADPFRILGSMGGARKIEMEAGETHHFQLAGAYKSFNLKLSGSVSALGSYSKDATGFTYQAPSTVADTGDVVITASNTDLEQSVARVRLTAKPEIVPAVSLVVAGGSVPFVMHGSSRKVTWKVVKGRGKFGDEAILKKLNDKVKEVETELHKPAKHNDSGFMGMGNIGEMAIDILKKQQLSVQIMFLNREIAAEEATYHAPEDVKPDEPKVEITAEWGTTKEGAARTFTASFELVAKNPESEKELKKALDSNADLQTALKQADAIDKASDEARKTGTRVDWDATRLATLRTGFQTARKVQDASLVDASTQNRFGTFTYKPVYNARMFEGRGLNINDGPGMGPGGKPGMQPRPNRLP